MASGNYLGSFEVTDNQPPASNAATPSVRNGHLVLDFDASAIEYAIFASMMPRHYNGGGITVRICWMAKTATSGNVIWSAAIERHDTNTDLDADSFAAAISASASAADINNGRPTYRELALTNAQIDGLLIDEHYRIKIAREATSGSDTMTGDAQLLSLSIRET